MNERDERPRQETDAERRKRFAQERRESLRQRYPVEFNDGARRAFNSIKRYPRGFLGWPLEKRNAWFAGFNMGYMDRLKVDPTARTVDENLDPDFGPEDGGDA